MTVLEGGAWDVLDLLQRARYDTLLFRNTLNRLVVAVRRDLNSVHARKIEDSQVRFFGLIKK